MFSNRLAFVALGFACLAAAGGGGYLATRQNLTERASPTAAAFEAYHDATRKNMAMFEQAMSMWTSFGAAAQSKKGELGEIPRDAANTEQPREELNELKQQLADMQQKIERLALKRD